MIVWDQDKLCAAAAKLSDDSSVENLYAASGTAAALGCPLKFGAKVQRTLVFLFFFTVYTIFEGVLSCFFLLFSLFPFLIFSPASSPRPTTVQFYIIYTPVLITILVFSLLEVLRYHTPRLMSPHIIGGV